MNINTIENHVLINIGDIIKDSKAVPIINNRNLLSEFIKDIVSVNSDFNLQQENYNFSQLKTFIANILLPQIKKFSYSSLPPINEEEEQQEIISKTEKNILPEKIIHFFIDAAMTPNKYKSNNTRENIAIVETFASHMDPAGRAQPNIVLSKELENISTIDLNIYGFNKNCKVQFYPSKSDKNNMSLKINLNDKEMLECKISRKGDIIDKINSFKYKTEDREISIETEKVLEHLFKGNNYKNSYINTLDNESTKDKLSIAKMFILLKELGDTMQAIILQKILQDTNTSLKKFIGTSCLLTNDVVLATRCGMLNVPYLLDNLNSCILTLYLPALTEEEKKQVQLEYSKREKITEVLKIIDENKIVITSLKDSEQFINENNQNGKLSREITISSGGTKLSVNTNIIYLIEALNKIIIEIEKANQILNTILDKLNKNHFIVKLSLGGVSQTKTNEYVELIREEFSIFRTYIYQLKANKLIKKIDRNVFFISCIGSSLKSNLFTRKIPKNLGGLSDDKYLLLNNINNITFESGFIQYIKQFDKFGGGPKRKREKSSSSIKTSAYSSSSNSNSSSTSRSRSSSTSRSITNVNNVYNDLYMLIYPYIYCYPWLIEYILDYKTNKEKIKYLIKYILCDENDENKFNSYLRYIFTLENENKYYIKSIEKNFEKNDLPDTTINNSEKLNKEILNNIMKILKKIYRNINNKTKKRKSKKRRKHISTSIKKMSL